MEYEEFKKTLQGRVQNEFPEAEIIIEAVEKNNGIRKEGMIIRRQWENTSPCIYLQELYQCHKKNGDMERCVQMACEIARDRRKMPSSKIPGTWEECKGCISLRLVNTEWNREYLQTVPHREFLDLSITFHLILQQSEDALYSLPVTNAVMEYWGTSEEELYQEGTESMKRSSRFEIQSLGGLLEELIAEKKDGQSRNLSGDIFVMMNESRIYGSCGMLMAERLEAFASEKKDDFYILPCSVHELILIPSSMETDLDMLRNMVQEVNETSVLPEERLSDSVYYFSRENGTVQLAGK